MLNDSNVRMYIRHLPLGKSTIKRDNTNDVIVVDDDDADHDDVNVDEEEAEINTFI